MAKKRPISVFTLSFLDVMAGGFGAVVIIFLIINHATEDQPQTDNRELLSESRLIEYQLDKSEDQLSYLRDFLGDLSIRIADVNERIEETVDELDVKEESIEEIEKTAEDQSKSLEELMRDIEESEREVEILARSQQNAQGETTLQIQGEGDRQYLTGLYMGGQHIVIALDQSASMLDQSIVNVLRRRNMDRGRQLAAPKWRRAIRTVEWLTANIPLESRFQIAIYNNQARFLTNQGQWIDASNGESVRQAITQLNTVAPDNGTNLRGLFELISSMTPLPDNVFLISDGLPTMDSPTTNRTTITGRQRINLFHDAIQSLPAGIPVNTIMFPLEGDPFAASSYWNLSHVTGGIVMSPSADWP